MAKIYQVDPYTKRTRKIRQMFLALVKRQLGYTDMAGFCIVTWNSRGEPDTGFCTNVGPVSRALLPMYVQNVLTVHIAASLAQETGVQVIEPDDPA
jgi:hypothetical protein